MNKTSATNLLLINATFNTLSNLMGNLVGRWLDEKEHEDINEYGLAISKHLPKELTLTRMLKRPFGFTFKVAGEEGKVYQMTISAKGTYQWSRVK